jgi:hypothetical protein
MVEAEGFLVAVVSAGVPEETEEVGARDRDGPSVRWRVFKVVLAEWLGTMARIRVTRE